MYKKALLFTLLMFTFVCNVYAESISVSDVSLTPGSQSEIVINCEFDAADITLYQFDLYLPEGVTPAYDEDEEDYIYTLSGRHKKSHTFALQDNGSYYRVVVSSSTNKLIAAGSGELLRLTVDVAPTVSGTKAAAVKAFSLFATDETEHALSDVSFNMIAPSASMQASISVSDVSLTPGSQSEIVINCEFDAADITLYQFDLYLPEGVTPAYDEDEEDYIYTLSSRHKKSHTFALQDNGSYYRVVVASSTNKLIAAGSGELLRLTVDVAPTVSGTKVAAVKAFSLFATDETEYAVSDVSFNMIAPSAIMATSVTLNQTEATLTAAGATVQLTATVLPENASNKSVTWSSSNENVATVSATGLVTAVANGTATITATAADGSGKKATCAVTVNIPVPATSVTLNQTEATLTAAGATVQLTATVLPENASNKNVTWSSSNESVATVSETGLVTAVANGTATITATAADGTNKTATCVVTVYIPTGVETQTVSRRSTDNVYTPQGQRITDARNLPAGVYIINGKKTVIK